MAFLIFERVVLNGKSIIRPTGETFRLAGYNLIYQSWERRGKPVDKGWHITAAELIDIQTGGQHSYSTRRLVIDFDPKGTWRIGLIELLDVYAYTWGDGEGGPSWTPLMLKFRDVYYEEYDTPISQARKESILSEIPEPHSNSPDFVEFLYINGPSSGWNWGKNGMTNAVFLQGAARDYFRQYF